MVVALGATPGAAVTVPVAPVFADGATLQEAITGAQVTVRGGVVTVNPGPRGVVLLELLAQAQR